MSSRSSAARYARALFDVAHQEADLSVVQADLAGVVSTIDEHAELARALGSVSIPDAVRRNLIVAIGQKLGVSAPVGKLLALLAERGRLGLLREIAAVYTERLLEHQNVVRAEVETAAPLPADAAQRLADSLKAATGKQITMQVSVNPTLLGGVVARVGGTVYDGSVRTQLKKMRDQLVARG